jgi:hypothetical protein
MKVAITGGTAGIGLALSKLFEADGHKVVALSRRNGYNIRSTPKVAGMIEPCDMFINNAQTGFAQTELLFEVWRRWQGQNKIIVNISTKMTDISLPPKQEWDEYLIQKKALEASEQLLTKRNLWPKQILVKPPAVATQPGQSPPSYLEVNEFAEEVYQHIIKKVDK